MQRHLITLLCLAIAIALYVAGATLAATGLLILGMLAECIFWLRLFRGKDPRQ